MAPMPPEVGAGLAPGGDGLALAIPGEGAPGEENQREVAEGEGAGVGAERGGLGGLGGGRAGEGFGGAMGDGNATSIAAEEDALLARIARRLARQTAGCYPRGAMRTKLMGTVRLSFCIDAEGVPAEAAIRESSGSDLLDRAALECVLARAAPLPIIRRCLVLPVEFRLKSR